ncbi:acyl-CoA thioesterase [candidate division KSB1 bacterium]|nr:acyl-CoA thioesterase [candidate division KSB1 bacterium]
MIKTPDKSYTEWSVIARPKDANSIGTIFGGRIMDWMDMTASICARRHSNLKVSTVAVENLHFAKPLKVGLVIKICAVINRTFGSSMEVNVDVFGEDTYNNNKSFKAVTAQFIIAAVDDSYRPVKVPELKPESAEQIKRWEEAGERRNKRNAKA